MSEKQRETKNLQNFWKLPSGFCGLSIILGKQTEFSKVLALRAKLPRTFFQKDYLLLPKCERRIVKAAIEFKLLNRFNGNKGNHVYEWANTTKASKKLFYQVVTERNPKRISQEQQEFIVSFGYHSFWRNKRGKQSLPKNSKAWLEHIWLVTLQHMANVNMSQKTMSQKLGRDKNTINSRIQSLVAKKEITKTHRWLQLGYIPRGRFGHSPKTIKARLGKHVPQAVLLPSGKLMRQLTDHYRFPKLSKRIFNDPCSPFDWTNRAWNKVKLRGGSSVPRRPMPKAKLWSLRKGHERLELMKLNNLQEARLCPHSSSSGTKRSGALVTKTQRSAVQTWSEAIKEDRRKEKLHLLLPKILEDIHRLKDAGIDTSGIWDDSNYLFPIPVHWGTLKSMAKREYNDRLQVSLGNLRPLAGRFYAMMKKDEEKKPIEQQRPVSWPEALRKAEWKKDVYEEDLIRWKEWVGAANTSDTPQDSKEGGSLQHEKVIL